MKKNLHILLLLCLGLLPLGAAPVWHVSDIGGGGYITGLVQNPHNPQELFARSDVGGVFKSADGGRSWEAVNAGMTKWYQHHVRSIAIDPVTPNVVYRAGGELIGHQHTGYIHRSTDGGRSWQLVCDSVDYFGNGSTRMCGEMLAIDPYNHLHLMAGSYSRGLWESLDQGNTWRYVGLRHERITVVKWAFGRLYVGTAYDGAIGNPQTISQCMDYCRRLPSRLYTIDTDYHLTLLYETNQQAIYDLAVMNGGQTVVLATNRRVMRSTDGGRSFTPCPLPDKAMYQTLATSPHHPHRLYTARKFSDPDTLRIYVSDNDGQDWRLWTTHVSAGSYHEFPSYATHSCEWLGASVACILPDAADSSKLFFTNWWGVTVSYDGGRNFYGHDFRGLNILCGESILKHHPEVCWSVLAMADHGPLLSRDDGRSYQLMSPLARTSARTLAAAAGRPGFLLWSEGSKRTMEGTPVRRTTNLGQTVETVFHRRGNSYVQCLVEDPCTPGRYWMMQEGLLADSVEGGGIYRSDDYGSTWLPTANPYPDSVSCIPHRRRFIDSDFLPVVSYQTKNASGTNQLLTCDHHRPGVVYVGEWTEGIWRTTNAGRSWTCVSRRLPPFAGGDSLCVLSFVHADPLRRGGVYAGLWKAGLWYSGNYGRTWKCINPNGSELNAVAMYKLGETIVVASSQHVYSDLPARLYLSTDNGRSWTDLYAPELGALRIIDVALSPAGHRIYVTTCGNGAYYIDY